MNTPAIIREYAAEDLSWMDGIILFAAASALFRFSQDVQEKYLFPNNPDKSLWASAIIGVGLLMLRGKDLKAIVQ
jgi:hypothetical protein|tara:strand:- start:3501 stop:3725 length:225 start_codon:yes stop_codon:yes gene_type:complete